MRITEEYYAFLSSKGKIAGYIEFKLSEDFQLWKAGIIRNPKNKHPGWKVEELKKSGTIVISHKAFEKKEELSFSHPDFYFFKGLSVGDIGSI